jgi:hypothetical protein
MEKEILTYLAEYVAGISPELWNATLAYIYAAAIQWLIASITALVAGVTSVQIARKTTDDEIKIWAAIGGFIFIILFVYFAIAAIGRFMAPEWYAIQYLLRFPIL